MQTTLIVKATDEQVQLTSEGTTEHVTTYRICTEAQTQIMQSKQVFDTLESV